MKDPKRLERYQRWKSIFGSLEGESVLSDLRKMTGQDSQSLVLSSVDGKVDGFFTIFKEGRRSVWIDIDKCLTEPPDLPEEDVDEREN